MMSNDELVPSVINPLIQDPYHSINPTNPNPNSINPSKRKRNLPGTPDPDAEVIGLSPKSLMATNRFVCEICNKGFQRDQNLQLHKRGHNLPWKLKQRSSSEVVRKKVYICPETTCVHHHPSRALGDLTGIKKHYYRKHGEKKWKCDKCSKKYAVKSDWKAHSKICGTREYKCDCGTLFSRKDSFTTHRAFCDALVEESARSFNTNLMSRNQMMMNVGDQFNSSQEIGGFEMNVDMQKPRSIFPVWLDANNLENYSSSSRVNMVPQQQASDDQVMMSQWLSRGQEESIFMQNPKEEENKRINLSESISSSSLYYSANNHNHNQTNSSPAPAAAPMSATALLQKAAQIGSTRSADGFGVMSPSFSSSFKRSRNDQIQNTNGTGIEDGLTRDFLGVGGKENLNRGDDDFFASMSSAMAMRHYNSQSQQK